MTAHKVHIRSIELASGQQVDLMYWAHVSSICVAGFTGSTKVTRNYCAEAEISENLSASFHASLIDQLAATAEGDLHTNPELHLMNTTSFYFQNSCIESRDFQSGDEKIAPEQIWVIKGVAYVVRATSFDPATNTRKIVLVKGT